MRAQGLILIERPTSTTDGNICKADLGDMGPLDRNGHLGWGTTKRGARLELRQPRLINISSSMCCTVANSASQSESGYPTSRRMLFPSLTGTWAVARDESGVVWVSRNSASCRNVCLLCHQDAPRLRVAHQMFVGVFGS
jgi:hypothetical protein